MKNYSQNFQLIPSILGKHVNTYTFTKALTENLLLSDAKDLPVAIVRPSMGELHLESFAF